MRFKLDIVAGKGKGREFVFEQQVVTVGRNPSADLVLYDTGVSRGHCQIAYENDTFVLRDIGSANGTFLNESLTTEAYLYDGDRIGVGPVTFEFSVEDDETSPGPRGKSVEAFDPGGTATRNVLRDADTHAMNNQGFAKLLQSAPPRATGKKPVVMGKEKSNSVSKRRRRRRRPVARSTVIALIVASLVVTAAAAVSYSWVMQRPRTDRSSEVFAVNEGNAELRFGAGKVDVFTPRSATFAFDYDGGKATLGFATGGIDSDNEVSIELNGKTIGHAPASPARWTAGHSVDLPRELLYKGRNLLSFKHHPLAGAVPRWGIARVLIQESALPEVDVEKANQLFELGKASFDTRSVAPSNLARSIEYFEEASLYLEGVDERPPLYYDIGKSLKESKAQLQNTFESHIFAAEQATHRHLDSTHIQSRDFHLNPLVLAGSNHVR
ncbi:MAG: FHA domain-containing protein [Myxococcota bacterium]